MFDQVRRLLGMAYNVKFCRTCNARERIIIDGRCVICGRDPR